MEADKPIRFSYILYLPPLRPFQRLAAVVLYCLFLLISIIPLTADGPPSDTTDAVILLFGIFSCGLR
jgi:hypothetical protein